MGHLKTQSLILNQVSRLRNENHKKNFVMNIPTQKATGGLNQEDPSRREGSRRQHSKISEDVDLPNHFLILNESGKINKNCEGKRFLPKKKKKKKKKNWGGKKFSPKKKKKKKKKKS